MLPTDNIFPYIHLTFPDLCKISAMSHNSTIQPEHQPLIVDVEAVPVPKDAPEGTAPTAFRYALAFPGSGFMKLTFKVQETVPSITPEQLAERGGSVRAVVEGFSCGFFEVEGGGTRSYFKATRIAPADKVPPAPKA